MDNWNQAFDMSRKATKDLLRQAPNGLTQSQLEEEASPKVQEHFPEMGDLLPYRVQSIVESVLENEGRIINYDEWMAGAEPIYASGI